MKCLVLRLRCLKCFKTVTQEGTQTHDLANSLPCSNQLSLGKSVAEFKCILEAELPGIQPKQIPSLAYACSMSPIVHSSTCIVVNANGM